MSEKILIVDDEADIREILEFNLENAGFRTLCAESAEQALELLDDECRLILLDVMMAGMSGFRMAEVLRKEYANHIPIIFLTARNAENDLLTGFATGGDDYIFKPFSINEVIARVRAVLKRSEASLPKAEEEFLERGFLRIDLRKKVVYCDNLPIVLSKKEFEILHLLAKHEGVVFSREELIAQLWQESPYVLDRTVDVHIARIRSKLAARKSAISNRTGYGYSFNSTEK